MERNALAQDSEPSTQMYGRLSLVLAGLSVLTMVLAFAIRPVQSIAQFLVMPAAFAAVGMAGLAVYRQEPNARRAVIASLVALMLPMLILVIVVVAYYTGLIG